MATTKATSKKSSAKGKSTKKKSQAVRIPKISWVPGEYEVRNPQTRQTYKVVYRGEDSPWNYCSCMGNQRRRLHQPHENHRNWWLKAFPS